MTAPTGVKPRAEVPLEYTWNRESVFPSGEAWQAAYDQVEATIEPVAAYQGRLNENAAMLSDYWTAADALNRDAATVYFYAAMTQACDSTDTTANAMVGRAGGLYARVQTALAFAEPELLTIGETTLKTWMQDEPRLTPYAHAIGNLFRKQEHVRSVEVESLLNALAEPFQQVENTYDMFTNAELPFQPAQGTDGETRPVTQGMIPTLFSDPDREVRRTAWTNYADGYLHFQKTLASNYAAGVKQAVFVARARGYNTALEASLFENNVPVEVFQNLINTYQKHIPTWHKYWAVRRKALGVDTLHPYDIWAPIAKTQPNVPYAQSVEWISQGMKPLGDEYVSVLRRGCLNDRWVDIYPNLGKVQGAFSYGVPGSYPFIMMSYADDLKAMSTLAHELGHSMHSYLTWQTQPFTYSGYSLFVAEVASNFNQALVRAYLMRENPDPQFQIALIEEAMTNFHRYFFIMPTLARFELEMHTRAEAGDSLTAEDLNGRMLELYQEGYGSELDPLGERTGITWAQFPHLYANFYVYQYATGISAAHALAEQVLGEDGKGDPEAAKRYVEALSLGGSVYAMDALKHAGVDMTTPAAIEKTFAVLGRMVDRLEELTN